MHQNQNKHHIPVLLDEVLAYLDPQSGDSYLDLTAGYGGHARAVLERTLVPSQAVMVDRDQSAVYSLRREFSPHGVKVIHSDFLSASERLKDQGREFDVILVDLGVSSPHLNTPSRGFSFRSDGPLDMRMDQSQKLTAKEIVNDYDQAEIARFILEYGEEPRAASIAAAIIRARPIGSTSQLAQVVADCLPGKKGKIHPATRTFQALRVAVNDELNQIEQSLPVWMDLLSPTGRLAVISFHSLEDRMVKRFFKEHGGNRYDAELRILTKHAVMGSATEIVSNPRARSAKLRAVVKINKQKGETDANSGKKPLPRLQGESKSTPLRGP